MTPRRSAAAMAGAMILAVSLGGCALNTETPPDSGAAQESPDYLTEFEELLPALVERAGAGLQVEDLREESCLRPEIEEQQLETRWLGKASSPVADTETANAVLDRVGAWLDEEGWERQNEVSYPPEEGGDVRVLMYLKDDIGVTATYSQSERAWVEILLTSSCRENPPEHRMVRSELDPDYGLSSQYYDDGAS
ncbi:hypothetical protein ITX31_05790 [Arthrobacter gandavensis]|uniref:hypothetical protein n=1 Tax=Arthrobacter gandavensis TaxID=169960 RepID=UPI00188FC42A|nr:hypothetical protein [Arthrobacter gandavensis]MBF4993620.1 hypothetical protein [Arthrobacter gandavensis]